MAVAYSEKLSSKRWCTLRKYIRTPEGVAVADDERGGSGGYEIGRVEELVRVTRAAGCGGAPRVSWRWW